MTVYTASMAEHHSVRKLVCATQLDQVGSGDTSSRFSRDDACLDTLRTSDIFKVEPGRRWSDKSSSGCVPFSHRPEQEPAEPSKVIEVYRNKRIERVGIPSAISFDGVVYRFGSLLGRGGFGQVFSGHLVARSADSEAAPPSEVALKVQATSSLRNDAVREFNALSVLQGLPGVPEVYAQVPLLRDGSLHVMAMRRLGASVWDAFLAPEKELLAQPEVACIALEALWVLSNIHVAGWVHRDVKPENFVLLDDGRRPPRLYIIDFGMATRWRLPDGQTLPYGQALTEFWGTARYASAHAHLGRAASRRDDLQSLAYTLVYLAKGELPWQHLDRTADMHVTMAAQKLGTPLELLCSGLHPAFLQFARAVMALPYGAAPCYQEYMALFAPLAAAVKPHLRPVAITAPRLNVPQLTGSKRRHSALECGSGPGPPGGALAVGAPAAPLALMRRRPEWILVHSEARPMKQRYHHNVPSDRLQLNVSKGFADGMFVTHTVYDAAAGNWTLVMDSGQPFEAQELYLASVPPAAMAVQARQAMCPNWEAPNFLPQEWIRVMWRRGCFITSVAASGAGELLVVVSQGGPITQQTYRCSHLFPYAWVRRKWKAGFRITALCCAPWSQVWAVVMSQGTPYTHQMVELDFTYPSDGIQQYWSQGLLITCCAASSRESVFVLSRDGSGRGVSAQETARSPAFPVDHVTSNWRKNYYISAICHGPSSM